MTTCTQPVLAPGLDEHPDRPARAEPPRGVHVAMWMWRCAIVLPHPALLRTPPSTAKRPPPA